MSPPRIIRLVIWLSLVSGLLAAGLGISRASGGGYDGRAVELHRWFGLAVPVATATTLWLQRNGGGSKGSVFAIWGYRSMLSLTLLLLVGAGHFGGNLTHGSKYLLQNAPAFLKKLSRRGIPGEYRRFILRPCDCSRARCLGAEVC